MARDAWVTQYTPTAAYQNVVVPPIPGAVGARPSTSATVSGGLPPAPSSPTGSGANGSNAGGSNVGGIVGGAVGVVVLIGAVVLLIYRRRKQQQRQGKNTVPLNAITDTDDKTNSAAPGAGGRDDGNVGYQEPQTFIAADFHNQDSQGAVYGSAPAGYQDSKNLQGLPAGGDTDFQLRRKELENQQRQIELKRELLALEEQGQRLRPPGSQSRQEQHQYQQQMPVQYQQMPVQYPMEMGVSPQAVQTVQALPVTTSSTSMGGRYYPNEPVYAPHNAGPVIFIPTGSPSTPSSPSALNVYDYAVPGANSSNNTKSGSNEGRKRQPNNPHTSI
ncbi:hypothetical protein BGZ96_001098 [Linnemannia gamsii]|uniref:Uncharacterized protein n=1 Tax=Linnemannia gamsii TaxID=64522 RepID=A0ABQ7JMZ6_9FUNG|nr:hypothetical protein BGZ96_001098 [Linnemannia gamsii]